MSAFVFAFDWGRCALVYPGPGGLPRFIHATTLQRDGWHFTEQDARKCLPRFDQPRIVTTPQSTGLGPQGFPAPQGRRR